MSPRTRRIVAATIHRSWRWISAVGTVSPDDRAGQRYRSMGPSSSIAFPPGDVYNEWWISIGTGTMIGANVSMAVGIPGEHLDRGADPVITIGARCSIGRGSFIIGRVGIDIGDDITIAPNVYITDHNHGYADVTMPIKRQYPVHAPVRIGSGSWLATGAKVLPGADIGRNVVVAAGAVVRGVVPDFSVVAGSPARVVRQYTDGEGWVPPITYEDETPAGWPPD
jgi:acetyltransferase-like isoleucine patch superfamily enzyme